MGFAFRSGAVAILLSVGWCLAALAQSVQIGTDELQVSDSGRVRSPFFHVDLPGDRKWVTDKLEPLDAIFRTKIKPMRSVLARIASFRVEQTQIEIDPKPGANASPEEKSKYLRQLMEFLHRMRAITDEYIAGLHELLKSDRPAVQRFDVDQGFKEHKLRGICKGWSATSIDVGVPGSKGQKFRQRDEGLVCYDLSNLAFVSLWYSERHPEILGRRPGFVSEKQAFFDSLNFANRNAQ